MIDPDQEPNDSEPFFIFHRGCIKKGLIAIGIIMVIVVWAAVIVIISAVRAAVIIVGASVGIVIGVRRNHA